LREVATATKLDPTATTLGTEGIINSLVKEEEEEEEEKVCIPLESSESSRV